MLHPLRKSSLLPYAWTVSLDITSDPVHSTNLLLPTRVREYAGEDASPSRGHQSRIMHPAILPELGVIARSLSVDDSCDLGAIDKNIMRKGVAMSEMNLCVRRGVAEQLLDVLGSTDVKEHFTVAVEVLHGILECMRRAPREGHEPVVVGTAGDRAKCLAQTSMHPFENVEKFIGDVVEFSGGHSVDNGAEGHLGIRPRRNTRHCPSISRGRRGYDWGRRRGVRTESRP